MVLIFTTRFLTLSQEPFDSKGVVSMRQPYWNMTGVAKAVVCDIMSVGWCI